MRNWQGQRCLITGAEQGLGAHLRMLLEALGAVVVNLPGAAVRGGKFDIEEALESEPPFDIVINNFGIHHLSWIGETPESDEEIMDVNVMGPYWVVNTLAQRGGACRVVNVASQAHRVAMRATSLYCASKAALVMLTKTMARELASRGWVINALATGKILGTDMTRLVDKQVNELRGWTEAQADHYALSMIPAGRFTTKEEVALAVMLLLEMPDYVNGAVLEMTGGV
jgi:3-oxoacyl-[acyl-carrier protein] reductase